MSIDLQEATRRDDVFTELGEIKARVSSLPVFPSLIIFRALQMNTQKRLLLRA
jgi:hypothetical protein